MKYIKTYEGLFDYFSKESKDKRTKIREIKEGLIKLINNHQLEISQDTTDGNTTLNTNYGRKYINITDGNTTLNTNYGRKYININDDFMVDVAGNVGIRFGYDINDIKDFPCKFNRINGDFFIESIDDFIDKFPERVEGKLSIINCGLDSLKDLPTKYVGKDFDCSSNNLQTFEGLPEYIGGDLNADSNDIYTFDGLENYEGQISVYLNPIQSIKFYDKADDYHINLQNLIVETSANNRYDRDSNLDVFKSCDPIRPPLKEGGKPIIYLNRMQSFASELDIEFYISNQVRKDYDVR